MAFLTDIHDHGGGYPYDLLDRFFEMIHAVTVADGWTINRWDQTSAANRLEVSKNGTYFNLQQVDWGTIRVNCSFGHTPGATSINDHPGGHSYRAVRLYNVGHVTDTSRLTAVAAGDFIFATCQRNSAARYAFGIGVCQLDKIGLYTGGTCCLSIGGTTSSTNSFSYQQGFTLNSDGGGYDTEYGAIHMPSHATSHGNDNGWSRRTSPTDSTNMTIPSGFVYHHAQASHTASMSAMLLPIFMGVKTGDGWPSNVTVVGRLKEIFLLNGSSQFGFGDTFNYGEATYVVTSCGESMTRQEDNSIIRDNTLAVRVA